MQPKDPGNLSQTAQAVNKPLTCVVIPSDALETLEAAGYQHLESYYNPENIFSKVYCLSPLETKARTLWGMDVRPVTSENFSQVLKQLQPDIIRAYGGYFGADWAARHKPMRYLKSVPTVVSVHDTNPAKLHTSVRFADAVWCVSQAAANLVASKGVDKRRIHVLPNRVNTAHYKRAAANTPAAEAVRAQLLGSAHAGKKLLLHIGRKTQQKNIDTTLQALAKLPAHYEIAFVGQGEAAPYQKQAQALGIAQRCHWVASVPNSALPHWYAAADCFCTPSRWEGFGIVFIEAMAAGAPIITSNLAPMNAFLIHGETAHLVDNYEDAGALAAAVQTVCEDAAYAAKLSAAGQTAAEAFSTERINAQEAQYYKDVLTAPMQSKWANIQCLLWRWKGALAMQLVRLKQSI